MRNFRVGHVHFMLFCSFRLRWLPNANPVCSGIWALRCRRRKGRSRFVVGGRRFPLYGCWRPARVVPFSHSKKKNTKKNTNRSHRRPDGSWSSYMSSNIQRMFSPFIKWEEHYAMQQNTCMIYLRGEGGGCVYIHMDPCAELGRPWNFLFAWGCQKY